MNLYLCVVFSLFNLKHDDYMALVEYITGRVDCDPREVLDLLWLPTIVQLSYPCGIRQTSQQGPPFSFVVKFVHNNHRPNFLVGANFHIIRATKINCAKFRILRITSFAPKFAQ